MSHPNKAKGTRWESAVVKVLRDRGYEASRIQLAGSADESDVLLQFGGMPYLIQCKDEQRMDWSGAERQALEQSKNFAIARNVQPPHFLVCHKRRQRGVMDAYVHMPLWQYLEQLGSTVPF